MVQENDGNGNTCYFGDIIGSCPRCADLEDEEIMLTENGCPNCGTLWRFRVE